MQGINICFKSQEAHLADFITSLLFFGQLLTTRKLKIWWKFNILYSHNLMQNIWFMELEYHGISSIPVSAILELILKQASSKGVRVGEHAAPSHPILLFSGNLLLRTTHKKYVFLNIYYLAPLTFSHCERN